jgi:hypothetical protein
VGFVVEKSGILTGFSPSPHTSVCQNKISYIKLLKEFNYVGLTTRRVVSNQSSIYKAVNGVLDNSAFLEQLNFNIRKGNLSIGHIFSYHIPKT